MQDLFAQPLLDPYVKRILENRYRSLVQDPFLKSCVTRLSQGCATVLVYDAVLVEFAYSMLDARLFGERPVHRK